MTSGYHLGRLTAASAALVLINPGGSVGLGASGVRDEESLVRSSPVAGATTSSPPGIWLWFDRNVSSAVITVSDPRGVTMLPAVERIEDGRVMRSLPNRIRPGLYEVAWSVGVDDGHELTGSLSFSVVTGANSEDDTATGPGGVVRESGSPSATADSRGADGPDPVEVAVGVAVGLLGGVWSLLRARGRRERASGRPPSGGTS